MAGFDDCQARFGNSWFEIGAGNLDAAPSSLCRGYYLQRAETDRRAAGLDCINDVFSRLKKGDVNGRVVLGIAAPAAQKRATVAA
jgi:hypothetical protein